MKRLTDTSPEAERILTQAYRSMPPGRKWRLLADDFRFAKLLHDTGFRHRNPNATPAEIHESWLDQMIGDGPWRKREGGIPVDQPIEVLAVVREVVAVLDRLEIDYALGGSLASSMHGESRQTRDADISVEPFPGKEAELAGSFGPDYYLSLDAVRQAVRDRSCFHIINTATAFKVDVFVRKERPFERPLMRRRAAYEFPDSLERAVNLVTPEDIILLKLEWYRLGGEVSDRQWSDILGVLRVQADRLDSLYLDRWATDLGVEDLLARAREESVNP